MKTYYKLSEDAFFALEDVTGATTFDQTDILRILDKAKATPCGVQVIVGDGGQYQARFATLEEARDTLAKILALAAAAQAAAKSEPPLPAVPAEPPVYTPVLYCPGGSGVDLKYGARRLQDPLRDEPHDVLEAVEAAHRFRDALRDGETVAAFWFPFLVDVRHHHAMDLSDRLRAASGEFPVGGCSNGYYAVPTAVFYPAK